MTGYSGADGALEGEGVVFRWDAKSVNGRGFELKLRTPAGWEEEEPRWRAAAAERFARGTVSLSLSLSEAAAETMQVLNQKALEQTAQWIAAAERALEAAGAHSRGTAPEALLHFRGVLEAAGAERRATASAMLREAVGAALLQALDGLQSARAAEGARVGESLARIVDEIAELVRQAKTRAAARAATAKTRLAERVAALIEAGAPSDEGRLAQELAVLAVRIDVQEEVDRLDAHVAAARDLFRSDAPIGRRLDFLAQEFHREANTLCAKAQDAALTEIGLSLKVAIDQLKEQAANVE